VTERSRYQIINTDAWLLLYDYILATPTAKRPWPRSTTSTEPTTFQASEVNHRRMG